jgi:phage terminase small subunit
MATPANGDRVDGRPVNPTLHKLIGPVAMAKTIKAAGSLRPKHAAFVREFLKDRNATAAYVRAGYKDTPAAAKNAHRMMANEGVRAAISAVAERQAVCAELNGAYVLSNLQEIVERCMQRAPVLGPGGEQAVDEEGRHVWRFDPKSACAALALLGNHLDLFKSKAKPPPAGCGMIQINQIIVPGPPPIIAIPHDTSL